MQKELKNSVASFITYLNSIGKEVDTSNIPEKYYTEISEKIEEKNDLSDELKDEITSLKMELDNLAAELKSAENLNDE